MTIYLNATTQEHRAQLGYDLLDPNQNELALRDSFAVSPSLQNLVGNMPIYIDEDNFLENPLVWVAQFMMKYLARGH